MQEDVADALFALAIARARNLAAVDKSEHDGRVIVRLEAAAEFKGQPLCQRGLAGSGRSAQHEAFDEAAGRIGPPLVFRNGGEFSKKIKIPLTDHLAAAACTFLFGPAEQAR